MTDYPPLTPKQRDAILAAFAGLHPQHGADRLSDSADAEDEGMAVLEEAARVHDLKDG